MIFKLPSKISNIIKINLLILLLAMLASPIMAQNTSSSSLLYSFCGFRAGEDEKRCKTTPSQFGEDFVRARKAFRKFKDVRLTFKDGKLAEVFAAARFKNMEPNAVKKELDAICKDLAKSGILFGSCEIRGSKNEIYGHSSVGRVKISGDIEPTVRFTGKGRKTEKYHEIWVDIIWNVDRIVGRANQKPIFVKTGYYSGQNLRAKEECEMVMKKLRLPSIFFKPPATLVDAVEFFRNAAKDSQTKLEIVFDYKKGDSAPVIPLISATDISFYDALKLVLEAVGYKFTASKGVIKIERK